MNLAELEERDVEMKEKYLPKYIGVDKYQAGEWKVLENVSDSYLLLLASDFNTLCLVSNTVLSNIWIIPEKVLVILIDIALLVRVVWCCCDDRLTTMYLI